MTREQQQKIIKECFEQRMEIMRKKSEDYSNGQDVLSNFKGSGANIGITAEMQILSLIATKVARLGVLLKSDKVPENESIDDSIKDLANYTDLLYCAVNEGKAKSQSILDKLTDESKSISETFQPIDLSKSIIDKLVESAKNDFKDIKSAAIDFGFKKGFEETHDEYWAYEKWKNKFTSDKVKSLFHETMEADEKDGLYDVPSKYPTEYHKAHAESQGKC